VSAPRHIVPRGKCPSAPAALPVEPCREVGGKATPGSTDWKAVGRATPSLVRDLALPVAILAVVAACAYAGLDFAHSVGFKQGRLKTAGEAYDEGMEAGFEMGRETGRRECAVENGWVS